MILSATKIKDFKACRRLYYFKYVEGLTPLVDTIALKDGRTYHEKVEEIYNTGTFTPSGDKTDAMAMAYKKYIYPKFKVDKVEEWFNYPLNDKHTLIGRFDGITEDGLIVEHKTTIRDIDEEYLYDLQWNEQILCYMLAKNVNTIYYTVCKKPTIRQKQNETDEEFVHRCCEWYDVDTDEKITIIKFTRLNSEIQDFKKHLIELADEMEECEKSNKLYCNPSNCYSYGVRCKYSSICLNYNKNIDYVDFIRDEAKLKEKKENELF